MKKKYIYIVAGKRRGNHAVTKGWKSCQGNKPEGWRETRFKGNNI